MESVGERLKRIRKENNYTQDMLASKLDLEPAAISKYETNRVPIPQEYIIKICDLFEISADYLLGRSNTYNPSEKKLTIAASMKNGLDISDMSDDEKKYITDFVNMVRKSKNK